MDEQWRIAWSTSIPFNGEIILDPNNKFCGMDYERKHWVTLNRFRVGQEKCNFLNGVFLITNIVIVDNSNKPCLI